MRWELPGHPMIVVDTNVMVRLVVGGPTGADAARLFLQDPEWAAPMILLSEVRNVLLGFVRRGAMTAAQAGAMCDDVSAVLGPRVVVVSAARVINVALECRLTAHDAEFVVAARELGVPLATRDRAILTGAGDVAMAGE